MSTKAKEAPNQPAAMTSTAVVGSTGLVGSHILSTLLSLPAISSVYSISRRAPTTTTTDPKLHPLTSSNTSEWTSKLSSVQPAPAIFYSALGTTKASAGSVAAQRAIDLDLNLDLARTARAAGCRVYVLVSTSGANEHASLAYPKMKGELEEGVKGLGFEQVVILRPGLLVGDRAESRPLEWAVRKVAGLAGMIGNGAKDFWAQDADIVGKAAVSAGLSAAQGKGEGKDGVWLVGQSDIVRLGRTEWKL